MEANELRIGNIVKVNNPMYWPKLKDVPVTVVGITQKYFEDKNRMSISVNPISSERALHCGTVHQFDHYVEPIPLTEEILTKCGFEKAFNIGTSNGYYWASKLIDLTEDYELSTSDRYYDSMPVSGSMKFSFLHQLQNLYFALTGTELEVKL